MITTRGWGHAAGIVLPPVQSSPSILMPSPAGTTQNATNTTLEKFGELQSDVNDIKSKVNELAGNAWQMERLRDVLKCTICLEPLTSSVVIATCCGSIFGCRRCANEFLERSNTYNCPLCRCHLRDSFHLVDHTSEVKPKMLYLLRGANAITAIANPEGLAAEASGSAQQEPEEVQPVISPPSSPGF